MLPCPDCDAPLERLDDAGEMGSTERRYRCPGCGTIWRMDPANTLYEVEDRPTMSYRIENCTACLRAIIDGANSRPPVTSGWVDGGETYTYWYHVDCNAEPPTLPLARSPEPREWTIGELFEDDDGLYIVVRYNADEQVAYGVSEAEHLARVVASE